MSRNSPEIELNLDSFLSLRIDFTVKPKSIAKLHSAIFAKNELYCPLPLLQKR